jgi:hypothetical protein
MPDLQLSTPRGATTVAELMHSARGVLLDFTGAGQLAETAGSMRDRISAVAARCSGPPAPAILIRPDGYVACAGDADGDHPGLRAALAEWFGAARPGALAPGPG